MSSRGLQRVVGLAGHLSDLGQAPDPNVALDHEVDQGRSVGFAGCAMAMRQQETPGAWATAPANGAHRVGALPVCGACRTAMVDRVHFPYITYANVYKYLLEI